MSAEVLKRIPVWGKWLRLSHWAMALLVLALLVTGFLVNHAPALAGAARDYHYMAGHVLLFVFLLRVFLLFFGTRTDLVQVMIPGRLELAAAWAMFKFYISLGRAPLPKWFAHNPFWMPIYLGFFVVVFLQLVTGFSHASGAVFEIGLTQWLHTLGAQILAWFAMLHVIAVFWHDAKGGVSDISAMVNGQRVFSVEKPRPLLGAGQPLRWVPPSPAGAKHTPPADPQVTPAADPEAGS